MKPESVPLLKIRRFASYVQSLIQEFVQFPSILTNLAASPQGSSVPMPCYHYDISATSIELGKYLAQKYWIKVISLRHSCVAKHQGN